MSYTLVAHVLLGVVKLLILRRVITTLLLSGNRDTLKRFLGIVIALLLLGYGLVRIGVGALLLAQTLGAINFPDLADAVAEVDVFIVARASYQLLPFSLEDYFLYIVAMGVLLSAGAAGIIARAS